MGGLDVSYGVTCLNSGRLRRNDVENCENSAQRNHGQWLIRGKVFGGFR